MLINYDSGAIPSVLDIIQADFGVSATSLGILGFVPYMGITLSAGFSGSFLSKYSQKRVLVVCLLANAFSCSLLALAQRFWHLVVARALIGFTQAPFVIYSSVWVEEFAPIGKKTMWVGLVQVGVPLGVMLGYIVSFTMSAWDGVVGTVRVTTMSGLTYMSGCSSFTDADHDSFYSMDAGGVSRAN